MPAFSGIVELPPAREMRLDRYIAQNLRLLTRSQIKTRNLRAQVNGKLAKLSCQVRAGGLLELSWDNPPPTIVIPQNIPLRVVYEDEQVIVVNKRQGMVVHPAAGNYSGTLMNALAWRRGAREGELGARAFIVHRLDKDTSGLIVCAYNEDSVRFLSEQFKARTVRKKYYALVRGRPPERAGIIQTLLCRDSANRKKFTVSQTRGKNALTRYRLLKEYPPYTLLALYPRTGRTHQLRVHLRALGCPIAGDPLYGGGLAAAGLGLMLHAARLKIVLPGQSAPSVFSAPLPARFARLAGKALHP